jgi:hypothetical protein
MQASLLHKYTPAGAAAIGAAAKPAAHAMVLLVPLLLQLLLLPGTYCSC